ncbi:MAG: redoxin domain-containing protein [Actinobacteria bacterium]|nr:redoxin domain-containing protein [Actinomycetota bacterium]
MDSKPPDKGLSGDDAISYIVGIGIFVGIIAIAVGGYFFWQARKSPPVEEGSQAPNFTLPLMNGGDVSLDDYKGKVVLLNIWATWCNPCREEMPSMEQLYQNMKGKPFEILAVSIDTRGSKDVEPFVKKLGLTFPILLDSDKKVNNMYQATGVPETFIIDKNGVVRDHILGPVNWASSQAPENMLIQHLLTTQ